MFDLVCDLKEKKVYQRDHLDLMFAIGSDRPAFSRSQMSGSVAG